MHIDAIDKFESFSTLKRDWDSVYKADPEAQFFLSWTWMSKWLTMVGRQSRWVILAVKLHADSSTYVAFFPLRFRVKKSQSNGRIYHEIAMAGNRGADYTGFICAPAFQNDAIKAFAEYLKRLDWKILNLEFICASDERIRLLLRHFSQPKFQIRAIEDTNEIDNVNLCRCPYIKLPIDWSGYLDHELSANWRQKIRRLMKKIEGSAEYHITHTTATTFDLDLSILLEFWSLRWESRKGERLDSIQRIYRTMLMHCFARDSLFLPVLWKGEVPLGALALLIDAEKRSLLFYVGGRDATVNSPPPGIVLHAYSIRYAIQRGFTTYDFLRGNEPYKYSFCKQERRIRHIILVDRNAEGTLGSTISVMETNNSLSAGDVTGARAPQSSWS
jgi:CelD/BcsL family acetyltransferase involved in cellulose biosynthesis